jgi:hypothetical protein
MARGADEAGCPKKARGHPFWPTSTEHQVEFVFGKKGMPRRNRPCCDMDSDDEEQAGWAGWTVWENLRHEYCGALASLQPTMPNESINEGLLMATHDQKEGHQILWEFLDDVQKINETEWIFSVEGC